MTDIGLALVLVGAALLVVEAHVAGGVIGVFGGMALAGGAALVIGGAGGGIALVASGSETLSGRTGVVRSWNGEGGQVFVDGALWRARLSPIEDGERLDAGDAIVVERVTGLTLAVRKAEEWEESW